MMETIASSVNVICRQILMLALMVIAIRDITHIAAGEISGASRLDKLKQMLIRDRNTVITAGVIDILFPIVVGLSINENSMVPIESIIIILITIEALISSVAQLSIFIAMVVLVFNIFKAVVTKSSKEV